MFSHSAKPSDTNTAYTTPSNWQLKAGDSQVRCLSSRYLKPSSDRPTTMKLAMIWYVQVFSAASPPSRRMPSRSANTASAVDTTPWIISDSSSGQGSLSSLSMRYTYPISTSAGSTAAAISTGL